MTEDEATATMINAGIDMVMLSNPIALINRYIKHMKKHITGKRIFEARLNDAVAKILSVKLAMGLIETVGEAPEPIPETPLHATSEYNDALQAAH